MVLCASGTRLARTEAERRPTQQMEIQASHLAKCERWKFFYQEKVKLMDFDLLRPDLHLQK